MSEFKRHVEPMQRLSALLERALPHLNTVRDLVRNHILPAIVGDAFEAKQATVTLPAILQIEAGAASPKSAAELSRIARQIEALGTELEEIAFGPVTTLARKFKQIAHDLDEGGPYPSISGQHPDLVEALREGMNLLPESPIEAAPSAAVMAARFLRKAHGEAEALFKQYAAELLQIREELLGENQKDSDPELN